MTLDSKKWKESGRPELDEVARIDRAYADKQIAAEIVDNKIRQQGGLWVNNEAECGCFKNKDTGRVIHIPGCIDRDKKVKSELESIVNKDTESTTDKQQKSVSSS